MTIATQIFSSATRLAALCALLSLTFWFSSCSSTHKIEGVPEKLPEIALAGSTATPGHHMATYEYPFDPAGNYVGDWAAEGERRAGRSALATSDDEKKWGGSHGGRATGASRSNKSTSSRPKSGGTKYVVKKGDTVERIARRYGVSTSRLKSANGLKSDLIRDGQTLTIPK